jgi:histidinol-phosphate aminotransferase
MFDLKNILRTNIALLTPYSSAREDFKGEAEIYLDANENAIGSAINSHVLNRYPDPLQLKVKEKLGKIKAIAPANIFLGNGSDEAIDILIRAFCNPGKDNIIILPPTYGMYEVSALINDVEVKTVNLKADLQMNLPAINSAIDKNTKLIFVCSPNNPTGGIIDKKDIEHILSNFNGVVVIDEAYIDFADTQSMLQDIHKYPGLVILQTFSKAWGLAGLRVGMAFANAEIISVMNKIKAPYNVGELVQKMVLMALDNKYKVNEMIGILKKEREMLIGKLKKLSFVKDILPSQANFLLVKTTVSKQLYDFLIVNNVVVRNRSTLPLCEGGLRITIGTPDENKKIVSLLSIFEKNITA